MRNLILTPVKQILGFCLRQACCNHFDCSFWSQLVCTFFRLCSSVAAQSQACKFCLQLGRGFSSFNKFWAATELQSFFWLQLGCSSIILVAARLHLTRIAANEVQNLFAPCLQLWTLKFHCIYTVAARLQLSYHVCSSFAAHDFKSWIFWKYVSLTKSSFAAHLQLKT